ncbi:MAG: hypothetical protein ACK56F_20230, partial [bacterium]
PAGTDRGQPARLGRLPEAAEPERCGGAWVAIALQCEVCAVGDDIVAVLNRGSNRRHAPAAVAVAELQGAGASRRGRGDAPCRRSAPISVGGHVVGAHRNAVLLPRHPRTGSEVLVVGRRRAGEGEHIEHGFTRIYARPEP